RCVIVGGRDAEFCSRLLIEHDVPVVLSGVHRFPRRADAAYDEAFNQPARLAELGMTNMVPPFSTSCANHTGHAGGWMLQWDGEKFVKASDLLTPRVDDYKPLLSASATEYADANAPWAVNESCAAES
ncbi:MAG: hypothetical protein AAFY97_08380, partial [Pseudomonadota bacterium]